MTPLLEPLMVCHCPISLQSLLRRARATARFTVALAVAGVTAGRPAMAGQDCRQSAGAVPPAVVELYTSEGCSSCPPADRWLSGLKTHDGVLALAFHVNYWDHLGWLDRFATPQTTQRQRQLRAARGLPYVYTPQVVLNGDDFRDWRGRRAAGLAHPSASQAPALVLMREGDVVTATVVAAGASTPLAGYWAVLQDRLSSRVTRGENAGEVLHHDHVVALYRPVPAWMGAGRHTLQLRWPAAPDQRVAFVVTDASGLRPVQGLALACPGAGAPQ